MIDPFPEEHELISFFETIPTYSEIGRSRWTRIPKAYTDAVLTSTRGSSVVTFTVEPASYFVRIEISSDSGTNVNLDLHWAKAMTIEEHPRLGNTLVLKVSQPNLQDLRLRLTPGPSVGWGTERNPDL
jgi:hypothetical protein